MGHLKLSLLGPFQATLDGAPVRWLASSSVRALLAYLAVEADSPHPRQIVAALLWPEQPDREALAHLRHLLFELRRALGDGDPDRPFLLASRELIQLNPAADLDLDVTVFVEAVSAMPAADSLPLQQGAVRRLERAVGLYRGGFLEGLAVDSAPFEEWALLKREQLHWQAMGALWQLAAAYEARGEYSQAQRYARRQLELQPWQEEAHRQLMRALALGGQRSAALAQYQTCVQRLASELGAAPADETVALYQAILEGRLAGLEARAAGDAVRLRPSASLPSRPCIPAVFVAREAELAKLDGFLEMALGGQGRVVFVSGLAGSGKTALMCRFSQRAMARHPELVAAGGSCNAHAGSGDPYLPFREILQLLSGEIEAHRAGGSVSPEHARRLWSLLPTMAQALVTHGPDLVGTFVPAEPLQQRIQAFAPDGTARWERLGALAQRSASGERALPSQADLFDQVTQVLQAVASQYPLLLLLDDLQWADNGTLGLLFHLGRRLGEGRILVVCAHRPATMSPVHPPVSAGLPPSTGGLTVPRTTESAGQWGRHPLEPVLLEFGRDWGDIRVDLDQADGRAFVEALLDTEPNRLGAAFRETLYQHTGGNPLFTVEFLRSLQDRGDLVHDEAGHWVEGPALHWERLPARVEAVIAERFGRLPAECRDLLRVAAVEGEEFTAEVLARVANLGLSEVIHRLSETLSRQHHLVHAVRLVRREPGGQYLSCYRFAHILFQHYVYNQLDEVARAHLHHSVAEALEGLRLEGEAEVQGGVQGPTAPVRLAWHWEAAGRFGRAATYLLEAGKRAARLSAFEEAVQLLRRGLALLDRVPEGPERAQLEKQMLISLIHPLTPSQGWASAERAQLAQRALDLEQHGPTSEADLIGALYLQAEILNAQGKHAESRDLAELLLHLAQRSANPAYLGLGYYARGSSRFFSGDLAGSVSDFRQALALYESRVHAHLLPWTEGDLGVRCLSLLAIGLCYMGCADQGRFYSRQTLALAQEVADPLTEGVALAFAGCSFHALCREIPPTQEYARRLIDLSEHKRLPMFRSYGLIYQGWAQVLGGAGAPAIGRIQQGLAEWRAMGHRSGTPFLLSLLAEALQHSGAWEQALSAVEEGLALGVEIDAPHRPDLYRLRGDLLIHAPTRAGGGEPPPSEQAEACFHTAIAEARQNGSKLFELRAMASLARLWAESGRREEAHQALADIYGSFSEGFDTPDLRAAKALLDALEAGRPASSVP